MILLLDTATAICKISIEVDGRIHQYIWESDRQLAKGLLEFIRKSLSDLKADFSDISGIGVLAGPGSFTGLRIGLTIANTLASSLRVPIVGVSGESWQQEAIKYLNRGQNHEIVLPMYGGEANISKPRK